MRAVVQRVKQASVRVHAEQIAAIGSGALVLLGVGKNDSEDDAQYLAEKITGLRIFPDEHADMNLALSEVSDHAVLVVSQFTLFGDCRKGRRPSFTNAASPERAEELYYSFIQALQAMGVRVACGRFRSMMEVSLVNDGPVTILLDSEKEF